MDDMDDLRGSDVNESIPPSIQKKNLPVVKGSPRLFLLLMLLYKLGER